MPRGSRCLHVELLEYLHGKREVEAFRSIVRLLGLVLLSGTFAYRVEQDIRVDEAHRGHVPHRGLAGPRPEIWMESMTSSCSRFSRSNSVSVEVIFPDDPEPKH